MGPRDGSTCRPAENYDSSFSSVAGILVSCGTFKVLDLRLRGIYREHVSLLLHDTIYRTCARDVCDASVRFEKKRQEI